MRTKLKTFLLAILAVALIIGSLFVFKKRPSAASYSYYESLKIAPSSLNGNSIWGASESYDTVVAAKGLDAWAAFYSASRKTSGGLGTSGALTINGVPYQLGWTGTSNYDGNDTIRLYSGHTETTINLDTIGAYEQLYVLGTAGGPGEGNYANFAVRVNYTDGSYDGTDYRLYDWYDSTPVSGVYKWPNLARRLVVSNGSGRTPSYEYEGTTTGAPYLQSATIRVDSKKLVRSIDLVLTGENDSSNIDGIYCGIYAITGMVNVSAPDPVETIYVRDITETTAHIYWDSVPRATSYRLDIATDPDFKNILPGYNNLQVRDTSLTAEGLNGDTVYYTRVRAENSEGQSISSNVADFRTANETVPPEVTLSGKPNIIQISDQLVITAVDASGVKNIEESLDGGETWTVIAETDRADREVTENATYCYRATDVYDNVSEKSCITYSSLDTKKPVIRVNTNGYEEGTWTKDPITLTLETLTINVGETRYYYSTDAENWNTYTDGVIFNGETTTDGITYYFKAISEAGIESDVVSAFLKKDNTAPTGEITSEENSWNEFLNTVTFGLFFNKTVDFEVEATDSLSGIDKVEYLVSEEVFSTKEEAETASGWKDVSGAVSVDPEKDFVLYYKLTDKVGNVSVINSDGVVLDTTKALIKGYASPENIYELENEKTYYLTSAVLVTDNKALEEIKINGVSVPLSETNIISLNGAEDGVYHLEAKDKAGNVSEITINLASISDLELDINEDNYKTDDKADLETTIEKLEEIASEEGAHASEEELSVIDDMIEKYEDLVDKIESLEAEIKDEVDRGEEIPDIDHVTSDDRETIIDLIEDIKTTLEEDGTHLTLEENNDLLTEKIELEEKLNRIDEVLEKEEELEILNDTDVEIIKTSDREELEELLETANELLSGDNLTDGEREEVEAEKEKIEELLNRIDEAEAAEHTENIEKVDPLLPDDYTRDDKEDLENALEDLENALENYNNNYTDDERDGIIEKIEEIMNALDDIARQEEEELHQTTFPTISVTSETGKWIISDVARITAEDRFGVSEISVSSDGGETWEKLSETDSALYDVLENGTYIFRATNSFGNTAEQVVVYHNIDPIRPIVEINSYGYELGTWTNEPVVLTAENVANNLSPVSLYFREAGNEEWEPYLGATMISEDTDEKTFEYKAVSAAGLESEIADAEVKKDSVSPSGEISSEEKQVSVFLNNITFGLLFNETRAYSVEASDDRSGVDKIEYLISETELESEDLKNQTWTETSGEVSVNPEETTYIYYRITDRAGNVAVVNSDGIVFEIPGKNSAEVTIEDSETGLKTIVLSSGEVRIIDGLETKTIEDYEELEDAKSVLEEYENEHPSELVEEIINNYTETLEEIEEAEERFVIIVESYETLPDNDHVTSDDEEKIKDILEAIDVIKEENYNHLTEEEKRILEEILGSLREKLAIIEEIQERLEEVDEGVNNYTEETVTIEDIDELEDLREEIEELLGDDNVSESEKEHLEELLDKINELEQRAKDAEEALEKAKENDKAVNITPENVRPEDQTTLEDAAQGYAEALGVFDGNFSLSDLFDINSRISIINSALDILDQVAEFENMVSRLPNPEEINFGSRVAVKAAQIAYNELSEYGRSLVGPSLMAKYKAVIEAYRAFLEGSPLLYAFETLDVFWWGLSTFFIVGVFVIIAKRTHKRYAENLDDDRF
ncbi:Ig-like domain repeat protein [Candidatus Saccharibacteria bacterium]|nr:Ig-like domain repeat protein [Candidatus Saccharibacteria bacterium]